MSEDGVSSRLNAIFNIEIPSGYAMNFFSTDLSEKHFI
jgi:hypothetical protein